MEGTDLLNDPATLGGSVVAGAAAYDGIKTLLTKIYNFLVRQKEIQEKKEEEAKKEEQLKEHQSKIDAIKATSEEVKEKVDKSYNILDESDDQGRKLRFKLSSDIQEVKQYQKEHDQTMLTVANVLKDVSKSMSINTKVLLAIAKKNDIDVSDITLELP